MCIFDKKIQIINSFIYLRRDFKHPCNIIEAKLEILISHKKLKA